MPKKTNPSDCIDAALLEMAQDFRGTMLSTEDADKITMRVLGKSATFPAATLTELTPKEIRALRETANMSQAVFAHLLNLTPGYVAQMERGAKRPAGAALAMLHVIKRKGIAGIL